ncbi:MAG: ROK family transcriptional regulator [Candidatus Bipolaricaulia bacterium]
MHQSFGNLRLEKRINLKRIINLIRSTDRISRIEISRVLNISPSAVSQSVNQLIQAGMITKAAMGESDLGRKPTLLRFNPDVKYILSIEMGGEDIKAALLNLDADIKKWTATPAFSGDDGPPLPLGKIFRFVQVFLDELSVEGISRSDILGMAIAIHGTIDYNTGIVYEAPHIGWTEVNLKKTFAEKFSYRVVVENDVNCTVLAEERRGSGVGAQDIICVAIEEGVGAGLLLNGDLYRGFSGEAGEIGWFYLKEKAPDEPYQLTGDFERRVSQSAIKQQLSSLADDADDRTKQRMAAEIGEFIGIGLANLINALNPEMVILTGIPEKISGLVIEQITQVVKLLTPKRRSEHVQFKIGTLPEDERALIGAGLLVSDLFFSLPDDVWVKVRDREAIS